MTNKKMNIILIVIGLVLLFILFNIIYLYNRNEKSKIYFNIKEINNINWKNEEASFKISNNKLTFIINDKKIVDSKFKFDNRTGKFNVDNKEIYLRSITNDNIIIWYNKKDYNLKKEIIAR